MYNHTFILKPTDTAYKIADHFPLPVSGCVGIALSGGMESTLIAKIAMEVYGEENVVLLYSDNLFTDNDESCNENVRANIDNASRIFNKELVYVDIDTKLHSENKIESFHRLNAFLEENYNIEFTMWGFTKLFFDVSVFKEDPDLTNLKVKETCYDDPVRFRSVIEEFHLPTDEFSAYVKDLNIPGSVYEMIRFDGGNKMLCPFSILNKSEVVDLYQKLGLGELVHKTKSCVDYAARGGQHCGECFNCQQRYDAFAKLGVEDRSEYLSDMVEKRWAMLKKALVDDGIY